MMILGPPPPAGPIGTVPDGGVVPGPIEAWVNYRSLGDSDPYYTHWDLGFSRVHGRWGICVRVVEGDEYNPERTSIEAFHFNESPLYLRQGAVEKRPEVIEALAKTGVSVAKKLRNAKQKATEIAQTATPAKPTK
jgi:negative regulator of sigma E activity